MGFFSRKAKPSATTTVTGVLLEGQELVCVVGEASYQPAILSICGGTVGQALRHDCVGALIPEPSNPHDSNAVRVDVAGQTVGYLSRSDAVAYGPAVRRFAEQGQVIACNALIAGRGEGADTTNLGVFLHLPGPDEALVDAQ